MKSASKGAGREIVIVSVNVGTIAYGVPEAGAPAHGTAGTLSRHPTSGNMNRLLHQMAAKNEDGTMRVGLWALSSTCLPKADIPRAIKDFGTTLCRRLSSLAHKAVA